jgi:hypothetical protein
MVQRFTSFLDEDFANWQKSQAALQKQQAEQQRQQELAARRTAEWISDRPAYMKALDTVLPGQQFRTPPPPPLPPAPASFGDFRRLESQAGSQRDPSKPLFPGTSIGAAPPAAYGGTSIGPPDPQAKYVEPPAGYGKPPGPILPGRIGDFEHRVRDVAARLAAPGPVSWETPSTGSKVADTVADLLGTGLGFIIPTGAAGKVWNLAEAAAKAGAARVPAKLAPAAAPALRGIVGGSAFGGMEAATEGLGPAETARRAAEEAALWTGAELGLGVALPAAAKAIGKSLQPAPKREAALSLAPPVQQGKTYKISHIDTKYQSQYNTEAEIKRQLRKYYSDFDKEGLDEAAGAIADLRKTEAGLSGRELRGTAGDTAGRGGAELETGLALGRPGDEGTAAIPTRPTRQKPYRTVGLSFSKDLIDTGRVNLTGHKINSTHDLAVIAQVFRDPRFETLRVIYTKGDMIVGTDAISSRMPSASVAYLDNPSKYLLKSKLRMQRLEADGYYLLL